MFEILYLIAKIAAFIMFDFATYQGAQFYKNRSDNYENELEKEISKNERRQRAIEHFENLEK